MLHVRPRTLVCMKPPSSDARPATNYLGTLCNCYLCVDQLELTLGTSRADTSSVNATEDAREVAGCWWGRSVHPEFENVSPSIAVRAVLAYISRPYSQPRSITPSPCPTPISSFSSSLLECLVFGSSDCLLSVTPHIAIYRGRKWIRA